MKNGKWRMENDFRSRAGLNLHFSFSIFHFSFPLAWARPGRKDEEEIACPAHTCAPLLRAASRAEIEEDRKEEEGRFSANWRCPVAPGAFCFTRAARLPPPPLPAPSAPA